MESALGSDLALIPVGAEGKASLLRSAASEAAHVVESSPASVDDADDDAPAGGLTIDDCLDRIGFGRFQLKLQVISGLGYLADTAELLFVTFLLPEFATIWPHLTRAQLSLIPALSAAGTLVSAPAWGLASDLLGRRRVFVGSMGLVAAAGLSGALAPGFWPFVATRVLVGAGLGGALSIDFILFIEFLPAQQRGVGSVRLQPCASRARPRALSLHPPQCHPSSAHARTQRITHVTHHACHNASRAPGPPPPRRAARCCSQCGA
jgi:hypothetical protein